MTSWCTLGDINKWVTLVVTIECFTMALLFFMCGYRASKYPAYSQVRSFIMTILGFWFLSDGLVKLTRFIEAKIPSFSTESIFIVFSRLGCAIIGIAAIYGLVYLYRGIREIKP